MREASELLPLPQYALVYVRLRLLSSHPVRIFIVTGIETALTTALIIQPARYSSFISAEPHNLFVTLRAGQPKLISIAAAPLYFH